MITTTNNWAVRTETALESENMQRVALSFRYSGPASGPDTFITDAPYIIFNPEYRKYEFSTEDPDPVVCAIVDTVEQAINLLQNIPGQVSYSGNFVIYASGDIGRKDSYIVMTSVEFEEILVQRAALLRNIV